MSGWGKSKDNTEAPKFLPAHIRARAFLTDRGWEIQPHGNDNPASSELLVAIAGPIGDGATNETPVAWEYNLQTIEGVSGAEIVPVSFEIIDQESTNAGITPSIDGDFPAGLTCAAGTGSDQEFVISGTPTESKAAGTTTGITFSDGTNSVVLTFSMDIAAS